MAKKFDHDKLVNADPKGVAIASIVVIDALQRQPVHVQAAAVAATFVLLCERYGVNPHDVMVATKNLMLRDRQGRRPEFGAVSDYLRYEVVR